MSAIVVNGDTSGSITLQAPSVAGTNTLTLPANTGTVLTSASSASDLPSSIKGPAFSAYAGATTTISQNAYTKINFNTEEFDTNSNYDTSTSRFTPTVAGYYQVNGGMEYSNSSAAYVNVMIYKNGSQYKGGINSDKAGNYRVYVSGLVYLNGSTDYIELYGFSNLAGGTSLTYSIATYFQASMVRGA